MELQRRMCKNMVAVGFAALLFIIMPGEIVIADEMQKDCAYLGELANGRMPEGQPTLEIVENGNQQDEENEEGDIPLNSDVQSGIGGELIYGPDEQYLEESFEMEEVVSDKNSVSENISDESMYSGSVDGDIETIEQENAEECLISGTYGLYEYDSDGESITITSYTDNRVTSLEIPDTIEGISVTEIGESAFDGFKSLTKVTIPSSITYLDSYAFCNCSNLSNIMFQENNEGELFLEDGCFYGCTSLSTIKLPIQTRYLGNKFISGTGISEILIPRNVEECGTGSSYGLSGPLDGAEKLEKVSFEEGMTEIPPSFCAHTDAGSNIKTVEIPSSVINIGSRAFSRCEKLTTIKIPSSVTSLGSYAFSICSRLNKIVFQENEGGTLSIGDECFYGCTSLTMIELPSQTRTLGNRFLDGTGITEIEIPHNVKSVGYYYETGEFSGALDRASKLEKVVFEYGMTEIPSSICAWYSSGCNIKTVEIPSSVTSIGRYAFRLCEKLTTVKIPSSVTSIGRSAFSGCKEITTVVIPADVTILGDYAFSGCSKLCKFMIKENEGGTLSIGDECFYGCTSLTMIELPSQTRSLGNRFLDGTGITEIEIPHNVKSGGYYYETLGLSGALDRATRLEKVVFEYGMTEIPSSICAWLYDGSNIRTVEIPSSVTSIGKDAFRLCEKITDIYFGGTKTQWGEIKKGDACITENATIHYSSVKQIPAQETHYNSSNSYGGSGTGSSNDEQVRYAYSVLAKAIDDYMSELNKTVKSEVNTKTSIQQLKEKDQKKKQPALTKQETATASEISAAYTGLAEFYSQFQNDHPALAIGNIKVSDNLTSIEAKIINEVKKSFKTYYIHMSNNGYNINGTIIVQGIDAKNNAFFGSIYVGSVVFPVCSDADANANTMAQYIKILSETAEDVTKQGLQAYLKEFNRVSCITSFAEDEFKELFGSIYDYMYKKGYGKISNYSVSLYRGYKASKEIASLKSGNLSEKLKSADSLYNQIKGLSFNDKSVKDEHIKTALSRVEKARADLELHLYNYIYHPDQALSIERDWMDNVGDWYKKVTGKCPVDFTIYDEYGNILGCTEGSYCEFEDDIYIEMSGEVETIYVPNNINARIIVTGTGNGNMSYSVEQYADGNAVSRLNYYDVPIVEGENYVQDISSGELSDSLEQLPLTDSEGNKVYGTELLGAENSYINNVECWTSEGGTVYGAGEYVRGDCAELIAYAENGYSFEGWYINDSLVESNEIYRHAVVEDIKVGAVFKLLPNEQEITCEDSFEKTVSDGTFQLDASTSGDSTLHYYSDNEEVAEISDEGIVTIKSAGTSNILIAANATDNYRAASKTVKLTVTDGRKEITDCTVTLSAISFTYNGSAKKPKVTVKDGDVTLKSNTDYTVKYLNNVNAGPAVALVEGIGKYTGEKQVTFTINQAKPVLNFASESLFKTTLEEPFTNEFTSTTDGVVTFSSSKEDIAVVDSTNGLVTIKGEGTVTITASAAAGENYKRGTASYTLVVTPGSVSIEKASVSGVSLSYGYSGKAYTPAINVTVDGVILIQDTDYTVKYAGNKNPGTATITITGKGKYTGKRIKTFEIVDCVSAIISGKTYQLIPKNNSRTAVCSYSGKMVNNTKVYITDRSNSEAMKFKAVKNSDGTWKFINAKCELALAVQQNSSEVGKGTVLYDQTTKKAQNWKLSKKSDNSFAIMNAVTGYSIAMSDASAVKGTTLSMAKTESSGLQRFYIAETSEVKAPYDGTYGVKASKDKKFALNVASSSKHNH